MFGLGMGEIVIIAIVALLFIGPDKLPGAAKSIGKGIRDLRKQTRDLQDTIEKDSEFGDAVRELRGALRGDDYSPVRRPAVVPDSAHSAPAASEQADGDEVPPATPPAGEAADPEAAAADDLTDEAVARGADPELIRGAAGVVARDGGEDERG